MKHTRVLSLHLFLFWYHCGTVNLRLDSDTNLPHDMLNILLLRSMPITCQYLCLYYSVSDLLDSTKEG